MKTKARGTCGACFREFVLLDERVVRHGWNEHGGRRVGEYGRVQHSGPCFGSSRLPYEVSPDCTRDFVSSVLDALIEGHKGRIAELNTKPALYEHGTVSQRHRLRPELRHTSADPFRNSPWTEGDWEVRLMPGDKGFVMRLWGSFYGYQTAEIPSYEEKLAHKISSVEVKLRTVTNDKDFCVEKIRTWAPAEVKTATAKALPLEHIAHNNLWTVCGRRRYNAFGTTTSRCPKDPASVTCEKCKAKAAERDGKVPA